MENTFLKCLLLFTNIYLICIHVSDGFSTWTKFDGHIYHRNAVMQKYLPFIMYYGSGFVVVYT